MVQRINVEVIARFDLEGSVIPLEILWEDGRTFPIDRVITSQWAASLKAGGQGIRYTVLVGGRQAYLFFENPLWFVECINRSKCTACTEKVYRLTGWVYQTAWILSGKPSKGLPLRTCKEPVP